MVWEMYLFSKRLVTAFSLSLLPLLCCYQIGVVCDGSNTELSVEETPNSLRTNRPFLEAIADENNHSSSCVCLIPIEEERSFLKGKVLKVQVGEGER